MKIKDLTKIYVYSPIYKKIDGETTKKWQYKDCYKVNVQQDISELDSNSAGVIDFDRIKIRIDYDIDIVKNDGISLEELSIEDGFTTEAPKYKVISNPKIGKCTTYTCDVYYGE